MATTKKKKNPKKPKRKDYTVTVIVGLTGLAYSDPDLEVKPGDRVRWSCATNACAIHFDADVSPFVPNTPLIVVPAGTFTNYLNVRRTGRRLPHKYSVAAYVGSNDPRFIDDPQVIIDDSGGTGKRTWKSKPKSPK